MRYTSRPFLSSRRYAWVEVHRPVSVGHDGACTHASYTATAGTCIIPVSTHHRRRFGQDAGAGVRNASKTVPEH